MLRNVSMWEIYLYLRRRNTISLLSADVDEISLDTDYSTMKEISIRPQMAMSAWLCVVTEGQRSCMSACLFSNTSPDWREEEACD